MSLRVFNEHKVVSKTNQPPKQKTETLSLSAHAQTSSSRYSAQAQRYFSHIETR